MNDVLHDQLPFDAVAHPLPGTRPLAPGDWLRRDERYAEQMVLRDHLIAEHRDEVIAQCPEGATPARELLTLVADAVGALGDRFERPDGQTVRVDTGDPLASLGRLCQEDFRSWCPARANTGWLPE